MTARLITESTFRRVVDTILKASRGDDTLIRLRDSDAITLRFANNQVVQHVAAREPSVSVRVAFGKRVGESSTNRFDAASLQDVVRKAEEIAGLAPEDPEYLPPLKAQQYLDVPSHSASTAAATPGTLAERTAPVIEACIGQGLIGAGIMTRTKSAKGVAASTGLFGFERSTEARFSLTASSDDSSGWTLNAHRDLRALDVEGQTARAVRKAIHSRQPREIPAGHYPVILEPAAVAGIFGPLFWSAGAKSYYRGNSPFVDRLGTVILDPRLSVRTDPAHPQLLGSRFGRSGLASRPRTWVKNGVLKQLYYDRFTAKEHDTDPTPWPTAAVMTFRGPTSKSIDELVARTKRGILVTNFWYIRYVDPTDITVTGMTRDGTFLVEDGKIVCGLRNFRFHDSPLRCLRNVDEATEPLESITLERGKMLLPALVLPDFHFSSVTKF